MLWLTTLLVSLRSLAGNKLRSALAVLGIVIGVMAVIALLALGNGARAYLLAQLSSLKDTVFIFPSQGHRHGVAHGSGDTLTEGDALALVRLPCVSSCSPIVYSGANAKHGSKSHGAQVIGTCPDYFHARNWRFRSGRGFTQMEDDSAVPVAVLDDKIATALFGQDDPVGETILVDRTKLRVIGVLRPKDDDLFGMSADERVIVSLGLAREQFTHSSSIGQMIVHLAPGHPMSELQHRVKAELRLRHQLLEKDDDDFNVFSADEDIARFSSFTAALSALLGGIGGIALLVGGIGIMNIMLVSVTERTREIGIRKAIGARDADILRQFLIEAVVLTSLGGGLGILLGAGSMAVAGAFLPFRPLIDSSAVLIAVGFSAGVGVFFGFYPAFRAARLDPIQALHYE